MSQDFRIVFVLFPRITQLDFTGPHEVLWRAPNARCTLASSAGGRIQADGGLAFDTVPIADIEGCELLLVPGGYGTLEAMADAHLLTQLRRLGGGARHVVSVCTGSLLLGAAGLLTASNFFTTSVVMSSDASAQTRPESGPLKM